MTKPPTWTDLPPDTRTDAITFHRDSRDLSGEQKLDLIAAIDPAAYDRAHAALDAILGPLLIPYEIGGPVGRAAAEDRQKVAEGIVLVGEAIARFCHQAPSAAESDVVEMTEGEFRAAALAGGMVEWHVREWVDGIRENQVDHGAQWCGTIGRRVRIVPERGGERWCVRAWKSGEQDWIVASKECGYLILDSRAEAEARAKAFECLHPENIYAAERWIGEDRPTGAPPPRPYKVTP